MGTLYVVDTPMDNPEDVTLRALRALREVSLVVAQDIPRARGFLACYGIDAPLAGCIGSERESKNAGEIVGLESVLEALEGGDVALLSETERPAFSAPLHQLVRTAVARGVPVLSVPGMSVAVTALVLSGLPADAFVCLGFLPQCVAERQTLLTCLAAERRTLVAFEAASRLLAALCDVAETLGDRPLALVQAQVRFDRDVWRGRVKEALACFEVSPLRGEWALIIGRAAEEERRWSEARVRSELARLLAQGLSRKATARQVAEVSGWRQREVYRLATKAGFAFEVS